MVRSLHYNRIDSARNTALGRRHPYGRSTEPGPLGKLELAVVTDFHLTFTPLGFKQARHPGPTRLTSGERQRPDSLTTKKDVIGVRDRDKFRLTSDSVIFYGERCRLGARKKPRPNRVPIVSQPCLFRPISTPFVPILVPFWSRIDPRQSLSHFRTRATSSVQSR